MFVEFTLYTPLKKFFKKTVKNVWIRMHTKFNDPDPPNKMQFHVIRVLLTERGTLIKDGVWLFL